jgi:hypothetical protein
MDHPTKMMLDEERLDAKQNLFDDEHDACRSRRVEGVRLHLLEDLALFHDETW